MPIEDDIAAILALPRAEQVEAARALIARLPEVRPPEAWNSRFGEGSLFDAWTRTSIARRVHGEIAGELRETVARPGWRVVEIGGGNGAVWKGLFADAAPGELVVVDLVEDAIARVRACAPDHVRVEGRVGDVAAIQPPPCDALVCSMTLHHVAGLDAQHRTDHGLSGPGKREVLESFARALKPRDGFGVLVEADVDCELGLEPGDPRLADHIFDSYIRRCGRAIMGDIAEPGADPEWVARWRGLLRHWFLEQLAMADAPVAERDIYELTVDRWKALLADAGLVREAHRPVDDWALFQLYRFRAA